MALKKYLVKVKVIPGIERDHEHIKWWNCTDLKSLVKFLDRDYPQWTWFNVYDKHTGTQLDSYTRHCKPNSKQI